MAQVVRLQRRAGVVVTDADVYIGRPIRRGGWDLPGSKWANPFRLTEGGSVGAVLQRYEDHVRSTPALMAALPELRGKRLGCWCAPGPCHGDVLVRLLREGEPPAVPPGDLRSPDSPEAPEGPAVGPPPPDDEWWLA